MDELMELSNEGMALEPGKLRSLGQSILEEVQRANGIVRNMNAFAHGVDEFMAETDICHTVALTIALFQLNPKSRNMPVRFAPEGPCTAFSSPLVLGTLLYSLFDSLLVGGGTGKGGLDISVNNGPPESGEVKICFSGITRGAMKDFPTSKDMTLAGALSAELSLNAATGELDLSLPREMDRAVLQDLVQSC
jgi:hypothetical protein